VSRKLTHRFLFEWIGILVVMLIGVNQIEGQVRGVYPAGMSATNSGVTPRFRRHAALLDSPIQISCDYSCDQFRALNG
jgi:hypothetical protein